VVARAQQVDRCRERVAAQLLLLEQRGQLGAPFGAKLFNVS